MAAFQSESGIPYSDVNLRTHRAHPPTVLGSPGEVSVAEVATLSLEFYTLSRASKRSEFEVPPHAYRLSPISFPSPISISFVSLFDALDLIFRLLLSFPFGTRNSGGKRILHMSLFVHFRIPRCIFQHFPKWFPDNLYADNKCQT